MEGVGRAGVLAWLGSWKDAADVTQGAEKVGGVGLGKIGYLILRHLFILQAKILCEQLEMSLVLRRHPGAETRHLGSSASAWCWELGAQMRTSQGHVQKKLKTEFWGRSG